jgi:Tol biopolymer transport system component
VALSPDAKKAAVSVFSRSTGLGDIWFYDLARGVRDRFTSDPGMEFSPVWSRDGGSLFYGSSQGGTVPHVVRRSLPGGPPEVITAPGAFRYPSSIAPDNDTLLIADRNPQTKNDIHRLSLRSRKGQAVLASEFSEAHPVVSPDGKWLAYNSDATRNFEVYVQRFDGSGGRVRVSSNGGLSPRWSGNGTELFYVGPDRRTIFVARSTSGTWEDASSTPLIVTRANLDEYEAFPDGQSFVILESTQGPRDDRFHVILNWRPPEQESGTAP